MHATKFEWIFGAEPSYYGSSPSNRKSVRISAAIDRHTTKVIIDCEMCRA